jgi:hypothetical protein
MNERIQELALQAKFMAEEDINRQISYNAELKAFAEKFAELIVQECAQIADDGFGSAHFGLGISGRMLKEHFEIDTQTE